MATGKFKIEVSKKGDYYFNLIAANNQVIGNSEMYSTKDTCKNGIESVRKNAVDAKVEDQTATNFEKVANPKFEIYQDKAGEFRFRLKARNGEIILTGEGYKAKASCQNGIESVRTNAKDGTVEEA